LNAAQTASAPGQDHRQHVRAAGGRGNGLDLLRKRVLDLGSAGRPELGLEQIQM